MHEFIKIYFHFITMMVEISRENVLPNLDMFISFEIQWIYSGTPYHFLCSLLEWLHIKERNISVVTHLICMRIVMCFMWVPVPTFDLFMCTLDILKVPFTVFSVSEDVLCNILLMLYTVNFKNVVEIIFVSFYIS